MKRSATDAFGEPMAAIYDGWYGTRRADESTPQAVEVLAGLAAGGRVLELAVGTGRIALPLAARGLSVHGIDSSEPMVARYVELRPSGVQVHPIPMRYAWPSEIDLMARLAGLERRERWSGWDRSPFTASSANHVSVYSREKDRARERFETR